MHFTILDTLIVAVFLVIVLGSGVYFKRTSGRSVRSYFLGDNEQPWWMLAASGASTNFSVNGTVWNIALLMVVGMKSFFVTLVWWMPLAVFLMSYSGVWIRRCGVVTSAELNKVRFGTDSGARWARTSFAFIVSLFSIASLSMSYIIVHKFSMVFGCASGTAHQLAFTSVLLTGLYVLIGGFRGVVFSEFLQTIVLFVVAIIVGVICFKQYTADQLHAALAHGTGADAVTADYWKSLWFEAVPRIGIFQASNYAEWRDFAGMVIAGSVIGLIGCVGGAGGRYGEQRFLATPSTRDAAKLAALWQFLGLPRWIMTAGLCFFAFTACREVIASDPEAALPKFLESGLLAPGVFGLVVAGLSASFMTSFCSEINACASIIVRDLYQPLLRAQIGDDAHELVVASYVTTALLIVCAMITGWAMVESQHSGHGSAMNAIWTWMLSGLLPCYVAPLAMRWYWGRMNGWGFAAGCLAGIIPSLLMLVSGFVAADSWLRQIRSDHYTYGILAISTITCIAVSLVTPRTDATTAAVFYAKVRPFGWWRHEAGLAREQGLPMASAFSVPLVLLNVVVGTVGSYSLFMVPVYWFGHWPMEAATCLVIFLASVTVLYFSWYKTLPND